LPTDEETVMVRLPIVPKSERPEENVRDALNGIDCGISDIVGQVYRG
jgi:hypothetical protein